MRATPDGYDGIPYDELPIDSIEVSPDRERHLVRRQRKGVATEIDIEPSWAAEAALDPRALVGDGRSRNGESIQVIGLSPSCLAPRGDSLGTVLVVYLVPTTHPPDGRWLVGTAHPAGPVQRRRYWEEDDD